MRIIAGSYKGRKLKTTTGPGFRPAMGRVREALFSMLEARGLIWPDTRVLDLFAGSGSLGFEALSRGAKAVTFVESARYATNVIKNNAALLEIEQERFSVLQDDVGKALAAKPAQPYSLVFIDPPYRMSVMNKTMTALFKHQWLAPDVIVNAEVEERLAFEPEKAHPQLELLDDRAYGQTRVILWTMRA